jgi:hypothetical protein
MRAVTVCQEMGEIVPKGYKHKCMLRKMMPGTAWKLDRYGHHEVKEVGPGFVQKAEYDFCTMNFDGRPMALFMIDGEEYLQPLTDDPRAREDRLGSKRKLRKKKLIKHDAPGVAPEAPAAAPARPAKRPKRKRSQFFDPL